MTILLPSTPKIYMELSDVLPTDARYLCLAGAGVSMDPPSALPSARSIVWNVITACAPPDQAQIILNLTTLRYEYVIEELKKEIDPDLHLLDYFDLIHAPNPIHWGLAHFIRAGHDVITTNFDYFIERALKAQIKPRLRSRILPIITKADFQTYTEQKPVSTLHEVGWFPLFKIHGSKKNDITGKNTDDSLITTLKSLGRDRSIEETFAIEPYKKPALLTLAQHRVLLVLGYSGSDDFDIGPTLLELTSLQSIIWIDHQSQSASDQFNIVAITSETPHIDRISPHLFETLQLLHQRLHIPIHLIQGPTASVFQQLSSRILIKTKKSPSFTPFPGVDSFNRKSTAVPPFAKYIASLYTHVADKDKYLFALNLLYTLNHYDDALTCAMVALQRIPLVNEPFHHGSILNLIGLIYQAQGQLPQALEYLSQAERVFKETPKLFVSYFGQTAMLTNIGWIHVKQGNYPVALDYLQRALEKASTLPVNVRETKGLILNNIGELYRYQDKYDLALQNYSTALQCYQDSGYLPGKAITLNNMGLIYRELKDYTKAHDKYAEALHIDELLDNRAGQATRLNNLGTLTIYLYQDENAKKDVVQLDEAYGFLDRAYQLAISLGDLAKQATYLSNLAAIQLYRGNISKAIEMTQAALDIQRKLGIPLDQLKSMDNLAQMYAQQNEYSLAFPVVQEALSIATSLKNEKRMVNLLNDLGELALYHGYYYQPQHDVAPLNEAYAFIDPAYQQATTLGDLAKQVTYLHSLATIELLRKNFPKAIEMTRTGLDIQQKLGISLDRAKKLDMLAQMYAKQKEFSLSIRSLQEALAITISLKNEFWVNTILNELSTLVIYHSDEYKPLQNVVLIDETYTFLYPAYQHAITLGDPAKQADYLSNLGTLELLRENLPKAIEMIRNALDLQRKTQLSLDQSKILNKLAQLYARQKEFSLALPALQEALAIAISLKYEGYIISFLNDLVELTQHLKKYELTQQYLTQLIAIDRSRNDSAALYQNLLLLAQLAEKQSQFPQALTTYSELLPIVSATRPITEKCELLTILGSLALQLSDFPRAAQFYTDLLTIAEEQNDLSKQVIAHWNLSRLAQEENDLDSAFYHLDAAYGSANILHDLPFQGNIAAARGMLYASLNETKRAISSFLTARDIFHKLQQADDERQVVSILKDLGYSDPTPPK